MTKISWTCPQCGVWHSTPSGDWQARPVMWTYDGIGLVEATLLGLVGHLKMSACPPELAIRIASHPIDRVPFWASAKAKEATALRIFTCFPIEDQPFYLFCKACEFDATDLMEAGEPEHSMTNIPMKLKDGGGAMEDNVDITGAEVVPEATQESRDRAVELHEERLKKEQDGSQE